ncbi:MAG: DUF86 domain-containing protein [Desulfotomaculum sp.]|nr:DUF86 domain-containing protein [Desulfotomaculum sp.]
MQDILDSIRKIENYSKNKSFGDFFKDELIQDGIIRNLEIIGEAVKNIPENIKKQEPGIAWKKIAGLRDILTHEYFGIDINIVWDVVKNKLPELKEKTLKIQECHQGRPNQ